MQDDSVPAAPPMSAARRRARAAMIRAAQALMAEGRAPTIAEAGDRAGLSRATAYRCFSSPEALATEAALDAAASGMAGLALPGPGPEAAVELVARVHAMVAENEPAFRAMLKASLESGGQRQGRRLGWLDAALGPEPADPAARRRLIAALSILTGVEAQVALKDVAGLSDAEARETLVWAARALLAAGR